MEDYHSPLQNGDSERSKNRRKLMHKSQFSEVLPYTPTGSSFRMGFTSSRSSLQIHIRQQRDIPPPRRAHPGTFNNRLFSVYTFPSCLFSNLKYRETNTSFYLLPALPRTPCYENEKRIANKMFSRADIKTVSNKR